MSASAKLGCVRFATCIRVARCQSESANQTCSSITLAVKGLLAGRACAVIATSSYSRKTVEYHQSIYHEVGIRRSSLTILWFIQVSKQNVETLVEYIYTTLRMDLDYILPFVSIPEHSREIDGLDNRSLSVGLL